MLSLVIRRNKEEEKGIEIEILFNTICVSDMELSIEIETGTETETEIELIGANHKLSSKLGNNLCNKADGENKD